MMMMMIKKSYDISHVPPSLLTARTLAYSHSTLLYFISISISTFNINIQYYQTGEETVFKIKKTTKMTKVFSAYAQRKGVESNSLRFLLDGERIADDQTPKTLELEDQDQIDCVLEQLGGL